MTLSAFYDIERRLTIVEQNWFVPLGDKWSAYGFNELYREPAQGFPPNSNVWFGKTWVMREVTPTVKVGLEIEHGYNNAGMWTRERPFQQDQFRFLPKVGVSWKVW